MDWLLREAGPPSREEERIVEAEGDRPPALLRSFLRELLLLFEMEGFAPASVDFLDAPAGRLRARVRGGRPETPPVREIKGVTLHRLAAEPRGTAWWGRVIFDV